MRSERPSGEGGSAGSGGYGEMGAYVRWCALRVGPDLVSPLPWVRDLGIFIDPSPADCRELFRHTETVA